MLGWEKVLFQEFSVMENKEKPHHPLIPLSGVIPGVGWGKKEEMVRCRVIPDTEASLPKKGEWRKSGRGSSALYAQAGRFFIFGVIPAKAEGARQGTGVHYRNILKLLFVMDSGFRRNDRFFYFHVLIFYAQSKVLRCP